MKKKTFLLITLLFAMVIFVPTIPAVYASGGFSYYCNYETGDASQTDGFVFFGTYWERDVNESWARQGTYGVRFKAGIVGEGGSMPAGVMHYKSLDYSDENIFRFDGYFNFPYGIGNGETFYFIVCSGDTNPIWIDSGDRDIQNRKLKVGIWANGTGYKYIIVKTNGQQTNGTVNINVPNDTWHHLSVNATPTAIEVKFNGVVRCQDSSFPWGLNETRSVCWGIQRHYQVAGGWDRYLKFDDVAIQGYFDIVAVDISVPPIGSVYEGGRLDVGDWVIAEKKYYIFLMNFSLYNYAVLDTAKLRFKDAEYEETGNNITIAYDYSSSTAYVEEGSRKVAAASNSTHFYSSGNESTQEKSITIVMGVWFKKYCTDVWDVDLYFYANTTTLGINTGWVLGQSDYFNIYSQGGLETLSASGNAGRLDGGDYFNLFAYNNSYASSSIYWRNLVHIKVLFEFKWDHGAYSGFPWEPPAQDYPDFIFELGFNYYARGNWCDNNEIYIKMFLNSFGWGADYQFSKWYVIFYRGGTPMFDGYIIGWFDDSSDSYKVWLDIWFNKANASSIFGARATSYWYGITNNAGWIQRVFTGNAWGVYYANQSSYVAFGELQDNDGNKLFSSEIEMIEVRCKILQMAIGYNYSSQIWQINVFDYTFNSEMQGIPTPSFETPKTPDMPVGGFLGVLASWFSALINALSPAFVFMWSGIVYLLDGALYALTGQEGGFSSFVVLVSSIFGSIVTFMITLASQFANFVTVLTNTVTWFFGTFFGVIWGIIDFVFLTAAFNIITVFGTILGISYSWLAGTTYTNGWGQVYDFSYLGNMTFAGFSGGIVVFFLIFIVGFFIQIMKCFSAMSLAPILEPIGLFMGFATFVFTVIQIMFELIVKTIQLLVQIAHALRDIAPRPFGT